MILARTLVAGAVALGLANAAFAADIDIHSTKHQPEVATGNKLNHHNQQVKTYPKFESLYIKKYPQPSINCGACFGYYKNNWRSWDEACGTPGEIIITNTPITTLPAATPPVDPKTGAVTPKVDAVPMPKVPDPMPLPNPAPAPVPAPVPNAVPVPAPVPAPVPPAPVPEPKKSGEGKSAEAPQKLVPATPVSMSLPHSQLELPSIPLIPTLPVVNIK
ncbi:hypothetical protein BH11PLA2_BH11PLA2_23780 [soil metagenome]